MLLHNRIFRRPRYLLAGGFSIRFALCAERGAAYPAVCEWVCVSVWFPLSVLFDATCIGHPYAVDTNTLIHEHCVNFVLADLQHTHTRAHTDAQQKTACHANITLHVNGGRGPTETDIR